MSEFSGPSGMYYYSALKLSARRPVWRSPVYRLVYHNYILDGRALSGHCT